MKFPIRTRETTPVLYDLREGLCPAEEPAQTRNDDYDDDDSYLSKAFCTLVYVTNYVIRQLSSLDNKSGCRWKLRLH